MIDLGIFAQAAAAAPAAPAAEGAGNMTGSIIMIVGMFVILYVVLILPERRRMKKLQKEISELKINDKVMTNSGIIGTVDFIGEKTLYIKSLDAKFEIAKEVIAKIIK